MAAAGMGVAVGCGRGLVGDVNMSAGTPTENDRLMEGRLAGPNFANISPSNKSAQTSDRFLLSASSTLAKSQLRWVIFCFHSADANVSEYLRCSGGLVAIFAASLQVSSSTRNFRLSEWHMN